MSWSSFAVSRSIAGAGPAAASRGLLDGVAMASAGEGSALAERGVDFFPVDVGCVGDGREGLCGGEHQERQVSFHGFLRGCPHVSMDPLRSLPPAVTARRRRTILPAPSACPD